MGTARRWRGLGVVVAALVLLPGGAFDALADEVPLPATEPDCVADADTQDVGSFELQPVSSWSLTIKGTKPLCTPVYAVGITWQYAAPPAEWPQLNPRPGPEHTIQQPGHYLVISVAGCGRHVPYAERGAPPVVPERLTGPQDPREPRRLSEFFSAEPGTEPIIDDPASCVAPIAPTVTAQAARCVNNSDGEVNVVVTNPNSNQVEYTVSVADQHIVVGVVGGEGRTETVGGLQAGPHPMSVRGSDGTSAETSVVVEACPVSTTTAPATQTTAAPAGNQSSNGGSLAATGPSATLALTVFGGTVTLLGAGLLMAARRRRATAARHRR